MTVAYVLVNAEIGTENDVLKDLIQIEGVVEAFIVYGVYDIICKVESSNMETLQETVIFKVRGLDNVRSTLTMIVLEK